MIDLSLSDEQKALQKLARDFANKEIDDFSKLGSCSTLQDAGT